MEYCIISFVNTHGAIAAEKHLKKQFKIIIMPTPREISRGCGISIRFPIEDYNAVKNSIDHFSIDQKMYSIYRFMDGCYIPV